MSSPVGNRPLIGFREWRIKAGRLESPYLDYVWEEDNEAECRSEAASFRDYEICRNSSRAPRSGCHCGFYAYHDPSSFGQLNLHADLKDSFPAYGAIKAWGQVEIHSEGFRAQYAKPVVLSVDPGYLLGPQGEPSSYFDQLEQASEYYQLILCTPKRLFKEARKFGQTYQNSYET